MEQSIKDKIAKVYELVNRGATEGERAAAKNLLDKLMKKFNLTDEALDTIAFAKYKFTYSTDLEYWLFATLIKFFVPHVRQNVRRGTKYFIVDAIYSDYVLLECSYEYFRRHMKKQWVKTCMPQLNKCRKAKTKNKLRKELQDLFFDRYCIESKLYKEGDLVQLDTDKMSEAEIKKRMLLLNVQGGSYSTQIITTNLLENNIKLN